MGRGTTNRWITFYELCKSYPRFLRVSVPMSTLVKNKRMLTTYFKTHESEAKKWSTLSQEDDNVVVD